MSTIVDQIEAALVRALVAQPWFWQLERRRYNLTAAQEAWDRLLEGWEWRFIEADMEGDAEPPAPRHGSCERGKFALSVDARRWNSGHFGRSAKAKNAKPRRKDLHVHCVRYDAVAPARNAG